MGKSQTEVDVAALYEEVVASSGNNTGYIEVLLAAVPAHVADQTRSLLMDGDRANRNVAATLERLREMFGVEVAPDKPGKKLTTDHVQRWRTSRGVQY